ncbi:hypothetical protein [Kitasatospora sp. GP82]|uniref:hypothetical protein n=1 Tax=Kitasatospora sp. GP82 TaxID=3035089 RepID=UPI0024763D55|nr:hypothetical protein [Kitasatospora sp. GP82]MDH6129367.1 hypothetical protein [Kitasatospora sp. GP82]
MPSQKEAPDPLLLGETMRVRLQTAVRALLEDESVAGLPDVARAAAVVLFAKGGVKRAHVRTWSGELGRWLGVGVSTISHRVLPPLRARGAIKTWVETDDDGHPVALDIVLQPVWQVRRAKDKGHPLALTRRELATLLRLVEALFGPGWEPKGKPAIPAGRLAERRGPGAAAERLALLLLVLSCRETGWLRLAPGSLRSPELGRGAATLALLMRGQASPADARHLRVGLVTAGRLLDRLEMGGLVAVERDGEGELTGRVRLLPVAERHAAVRAVGKPVTGEKARQGEKRGMRLVKPAPAPACLGSGGVEVPGTASSSAAHGAEGDLEAPESLAEPLAGLRTAEMPAGEGVSAEVGGADVHTLHASGVAVGGCVDEVAGSSGACAVGVTQHGPERACAREIEHAADLPEQADGDAGACPLRGEQHNPTNQHHQEQPEREGFRAPAVDLPKNPDLAWALAPVADLWQRLERPSTRKFLLKHAGLALDAIAVWTGREHAPKVLADRLAYRRERQRRQGNPTISAPVAWMLERGLPQEQECRHPACDNGVRLDGERECTTCDLRVEDRRSTRRSVIRQVVRDLPGATFEARQGAIEDALRGHATSRAAVQAEADRRTAEAQARWEAQRPEREARAAEAERARVAVPCADCGAEQAAGLCTRCGWQREIAVSVHAAIDLVLATQADLGSRASVRKVWQVARDELQARRTHARTGLADPDGEIARGVVMLAMQHAVGEFRQEALDHFAASEPAVREAEAAYDAVMRSRHRYPTEEAAEETAVLRAEQAQAQAATWLLKQRLEQVSDLRAKMAARTGPAARPGGHLQAVEGTDRSTGTSTVAVGEGN